MKPISLPMRRSGPHELVSNSDHAVATRRGLKLSGYLKRRLFVQVSALELERNQESIRVRLTIVFTKSFQFTGFASCV